MLKRFFLFGIMAIMAGTVIVSAQEIDESLPFPIFPETTKTGETLCDMWFWRGEPPCFKTTTMHGAYVRYPTRQKARIIVDSYLEDGIYAREIIASFFGTLMIGSYRPEGVASSGDFWDSGYFGLVKLDYRVEAKNLLWDIVLQQNWADGKFLDQRHKALQVLSKERLITLRQYKTLKQYLEDEIAIEKMNIEWTNALVTSLSNFREWNEELLPLLRQVYDKLSDGQYKPVLQAFIDFDVPDDGTYIIKKILDGKVENLEDKKLCIRAAYVLDDEFVLNKLKELSKTFKDDDEYNPDYKEYIAN
ncbi:hypothetical protein K8T06_01795, partial [bacterium]|nr:hypothetical protein [bacterium]